MLGKTSVSMMVLLSAASLIGIAVYINMWKGRHHQLQNKNNYNNRVKRSKIL
jgi:hypothetical protein